mmetsp:Transcript_67713/g.185666  ORF Transcript_67713/g.185666 Transcript_67713/m.185666 type:complete len:248 (+) Transcript_67713:234-977(+)
MRAVALRTGPNAAAWGPLAPATTPSCTRARAMRQQPPPTALTATSTPRPHMTTRVHSTCVPLLPRARRVAAEGCRGTRRALPHRRVPIIAVLQLPRRPLPREAGASVDLPQPMRLQEGEPRVVRPLTQRDQRMCLVLEPCVTRRERRKLARHLLDRDGHLEARVASERDAEEVAHARRCGAARRGARASSHRLSRASCTARGRCGRVAMTRTRAAGASAHRGSRTSRSPPRQRPRRPTRAPARALGT